MKEPVDHILRPLLPWRSEVMLTECGHDASKVFNTITRAEFFQRLKDYGQQRTALLTCMTCSDTARRWKDWDEDPRQALGREIEWERGSFLYSSREDRGQRLRNELIAVAMLIEAHRDEFVGFVEELEQRRAWNEKKAALAVRPKPPKAGL